MKLNELIGVDRSNSEWAMRETPALRSLSSTAPQHADFDVGHAIDGEQWRYMQ